MRRRAARPPAPGGARQPCRRRRRRPSPLERRRPLGELYELVLADERADWAAVAALARRLSLNEFALSAAYRGAIAWTHHTFFD
ncbi:MAG TPA: hypothetical protein VFS43_36030 [Polyangiaceae bacterium]|nr:hypothetical protein [Polyangiaceae bacterium]